jgi:hypothetical protein
LLTSRTHYSQLGTAPRRSNGTGFLGFFKIPTLWNVKNIPPYFHDGSAKTLEEVVDQYEFFSKENPFGLITTFTEQDKKDIVEYLKLLSEESSYPSSFRSIRVRRKSCSLRARSGGSVVAVALRRTPGALRYDSTKARQRAQPTTCCSSAARMSGASIPSR